MSEKTILEVQKMIDEKPVFIATKSYCNESNAAKGTLFDEYSILDDEATVLELDKMSDGEAVLFALSKISQQSTLPNIFIKGKHIGGYQDLKEMNESGELEKLLDSI
ncbi:hypothetical protein TPHA_0E03730 [Tetrapisispora phaffii CBS 4417]|uniref:Glutaredoxin domain-containing protein n=1 Tax=Tetrapisispora phaffii (strain ATCC 24235 / CBS 4417 / NBRC 1672 / NRRL Y-8282 / UCD 70-5) TaxID=1071381 RepID=G8BU84_TETPH|nr:hypothetical protein TPHA_0E03730 [Tetrapisispora phaffii CBS 4417]CCE63462.1 hypothetical protein TPHA_0E03730 [Tetrapisispora phaffii CBS 4417]